MTNLFELPYNHAPELTAGVLEPDCAAILKTFFRDLRQSRARAKDAEE